ncbi:MAG: hypothetical protein LBD33_01390 [Puniceicoccales bacterium]|jgi:hypothetical protein|nr:hypothetical protein [Puniceicoccales bacterium]
MSEKSKEAAIFAITQLMELIRRLPIKFFDTQENRVQILESMQSELDELIILEEQEQAEVTGNDILPETQAEEKTDSSNVIKNA